MTVSDLLPANAAFVGAASSQGTVAQSAGSVSCAFGTVSHNQTVALTIELQTVSLASLTNIATVSTDTPDPVPTNNAAVWVTGVTQASQESQHRYHNGAVPDPSARPRATAVFDRVFPGPGEALDGHPRS